MHPISLFLAANTVSPKYGMDISCPEILTQRDTEETSVDNEMKRRAVSEVIGTVILVGVVMIGIVLVGLLLLSNPAPTKVPAFDSIISNRSKTIYIYHKGGDPLFAGQYKVFVDGVDQTGSFAIMSPGSEPWSVGETLAATLSTMPRHVVLLLTQAGGGGTVISESDLSPILIVPLHPTTPPSVAWSSSPAFGNATTLFQFTDSSTGEYISSFYWNFNDANTSTTQSPAHAFPCNTGESCVYSINHSVTNSGGSPWEATSWLNRSAWVTVYKNLTPTVTFTQDTTSGNPPLTVTFTATQAGAIKVDTWYWSFGDSGSSTSQNPSHTYTTTGHYTVSLMATNYTLGMTTVTKASLITVTPNPPLYSCDWLYRKNITLNKTAVSGTLTYFPVLISYTDSDLSAQAQADGDDILFTSEGGTTKIPHETESYSSGTLVAWVNVSSLSSAANTTIYMYYGNGTVSSQQQVIRVWDGNYKGVWHLNTVFTDSTSNNNHGTNSGTTDVAGKIGRARNFSGSQRISVADSTSLHISGTLTVEAWIRPADLTVWRTIVSKLSGAQEDLYLAFNSAQFYLGLNPLSDWTPGISYSTGSWQHLLVSYDNTNVRVYKNGAQSDIKASTGTRTLGSNTNKLFIGCNTQWGEYWDGRIDEVRISNLNRSSQWIATEYTNQNNPALFHYNMTQEAWTC